MSQLGFRCVCSFGKEPFARRAEDGTVTLEWPHGKPDQCIPISVEILEQMVADANALRSTIRDAIAEYDSDEESDLIAWRMHGILAGEIVRP